MLQLMEKLQAQIDSRDQHDGFHNRLDRSTEPFALVAEYMGYGLFNEIVIVNEDEDEDVRLVRQTFSIHVLIVNQFLLD